MTRTFFAAAFLAVFASLGLLVVQAQASILLDPSHAKYVGSIIPGEPASEALEASYINTLVGFATGTTTAVIEDLGKDGIPGGTNADADTIRTYARSSLAGPFPAATDADAFKQEGGTTTANTDIYQYILAKYDGPNGADFVWYFKDGVKLSDLVFPATWDFPGHSNLGLSHFSAYNMLPDSGIDEEIPEPVSLIVWSVLGVVAASVVQLRRNRN